MMFDLGASKATVMASASDATIRNAVREAENRIACEVMVDTMGFGGWACEGFGLMFHVVTGLAIQRGFAKFVALDASSHGDIFLLPQDIAFPGRSMTSVALRRRCQMFLVAEEDKGWELIKALPRNRFAAFLELRQFPDGWTILFDALMAIHAIGAGGNF